MKTRQFIATVVIFMLAVTTVCIASDAGRKVFIGSMGSSDEAERFRLILRDELDKLNVRTVDTAEGADAILTGIVTVKVYDDDSDAHATVTLKDRNGRRLWSGDYGPGFWYRKDEVKTRARRIAKDLKHALET